MSFNVKPIVMLSSIFLLGCTSLNRSNSEQELSPYDRDTRELVKLVGVLDTAEGISNLLKNKMWESLKHKNPNTPDEAFSLLEKEIDTAIEITTPIFIDQIAKIYRKYFTHDEVKELIKYYKTPLSKKVRDTAASISREAIVETQKWAPSIIPRVNDVLKIKFKESGMDIKL